jgi:hypothetical protein
MFWAYPSSQLSQRWQSGDKLTDERKPNVSFNHCEKHTVSRPVPSRHRGVATPRWRLILHEGAGSVIRQALSLPIQSEGIRLQRGIPIHSSCIDPRRLKIGRSPAT